MSVVKEGLLDVELTTSMSRPYNFQHLWRMTQMRDGDDVCITIPIPVKSGTG